MNIRWIPPFQTYFNTRYFNFLCMDWIKAQVESVSFDKSANVFPVGFDPSWHRKEKDQFFNLMSHWHDSFSQCFNILFLKIKFWKTFESAAWFYMTGNWIEKISMKQFKNISKNLAKNLVVTHFHPKYCWSHLWSLFDRNVLISASAVSGSQGGVQASAGKCCYFAGNLLSPWLSLVVLKYFSLSL